MPDNIVEEAMKEANIYYESPYGNYINGDNLLVAFEKIKQKLEVEMNETVKQVVNSKGSGTYITNLNYVSGKLVLLNQLINSLK